MSGGDVKELIRDIDPDAYTKPKLSASKAERKTAKAARREEVNQRKAVQEERRHATSRSHNLRSLEVVAVA